MKPQQALQDVVQTLETAMTQSGETLGKLSEASPVLLVFLRHAGCTFCREALGDISRARTAIEASGTRIVLVHMGDSGPMDSLLAHYGLSHLDRICDRDQQLYQAFGLRRGRLWQLFGPKVIWRGLSAGLFAGHGLGRISADSAQMPGVFVLRGSGIVRRFRHRSASDRPDYAAVCALSAD